LEVKPRGVVSVLSRTDRTGQWDLPEHFRAVACVGDVRLDLCRARFLPGTSVIEVMAIIGKVVITVPHGVRVECDAFKIRRRSRAVPREDAPCVRITGMTVLGEVRISVVDPDERR
jgi:hypothetical protein